MMWHYNLGTVQYDQITQTVGNIKNLQFWEVVHSPSGPLGLHPQVSTSHLTNPGSVLPGSVEEHLVVVWSFVSSHCVSYRL